ncbi:MAG TPA: haloacid dehalogenase, partial [Thermoanaerobaculia bacterium]
MTPKYQLVFFDVDSTLVTIEGIDVLAAGKPEVVKLTEAAMTGEIPLDQVYARRLEMIRPTRDAVTKLMQRYLDSLVAGAEETILALKRAGCVIHLITAGIEQAVVGLAWAFGVKLHAVRLEFTESGEYKDFDRGSPLTRPGG